jgi:hypothetical protein
MPRSPQWSPSLWFPYQDPIHPSLLTQMCHMPSPSHYLFVTTSSYFKKWSPVIVVQ